MVERIIGNDEVGSSILPRGTSLFNPSSIEKIARSRRGFKRAKILPELRLSGVEQGAVINHNARLLLISWLTHLDDTLAAGNDSNIEVTMTVSPT